MIAAISRLTTDYVETEDRLRLSGEIAGGPPVSMWLTQRVALRLLPELLKWLDAKIGATPGQGAGVAQAAAQDVHKEVVHGFAQEAALAELKPQERVSAGTATVSLIETIEIRPGEQQILLVFRGTDGQAAGLGVTVPELRQWLAIMRTVWLNSGWPEAAWPEWMKGEARPVERQIVLH